MLFIALTVIALKKIHLADNIYIFLVEQIFLKIHFILSIILNNKKIISKVI